MPIRRIRSLLICLSVASILMPLSSWAEEDKPGGHALKPTSDNFQRLAKIAGQWKGRKPDHKGNMREVTVEYRLTSGGSTLVEHLFKGSEEEMLSVYHDDGKRVMMTHYCGLRNQPRMVAKEFKKNTLHFEFMDGTNLASPKEMHMHSLKLTVHDDDHISHEWELFRDGRKRGGVSFKLTRVKPQNTGKAQ